MEKEIVINDIKRIISEISYIAIENISEEMSLLDDLEIDYLDFEDIIFSVEEKYDINISDEQLQKIDTIIDILTYIGFKWKTL